MNTTGIRLRELERGDLALLNLWRNDHEQVAPLGGPFRFVSAEAEARWYDGYLASRANNVRLAICAPDGAMIGVVYLLGIDWVHRCTEFAIWIGEPQARGKKYGEQATRLAVQHAFDDLNLERVHLEVLTHNVRAIRLYTQVGFREEGVKRLAAFKQGKRHDVMLMGLLRGEYVGPGG